jgi:RNA polymerase sigma factor (sigma-70 family)
VLGELDESEQRLIRMRYLQGCTQAEVAQCLGTNQVAVSRLERRILGKLRRRLD